MHTVVTALGTLPDDQRAVLPQVGVEDLSYAEAAHVLGVPIGTVVSRLRRWRERPRRRGRAPGVAESEASDPVLPVGEDDL